MDKYYAKFYTYVYFLKSVWEIGDHTLLRNIINSVPYRACHF